MRFGVTRYQTLNISVHNGFLTRIEPHQRLSITQSFVLATAPGDTSLSNTINMRYEAKLGPVTLNWTYVSVTAIPFGAIALYQCCQVSPLRKRGRMEQATPQLLL